MTRRFFSIAGMILLAALSRLVPHPWNMTPVAAIALFAGVQFDKKSQAFLVPLLSLLLSDAILGFHNQMLFVYAAIAGIVLVGFAVIKHRSTAAIATASLTGSVLFFIVTNFGVWLVTPTFSRSVAGLMECYVLAIPFFRNSLIGDLFYTGLLFGTFALAEKAVPQLQRKSVRA